MEKILYTIQQVSEMVQMTPDYIYRLIRSGQLGCYRIGSSVRISQEQINAWLNSKRIYTKSEAYRKATRYV